MERAKEKVMEKVREKVMERAREKVMERVMERAREKVMEKVTEKVMEKAREKVREKVREKIMERAREKVMEKLAGVSVLCHGEGNGVHYGRYQVLPNGVGVPYSSKELIEQGNLFVRGSVCCQELLEVDLNRFDLGRVTRPRGRALRWGLVLHRNFVGQEGVGRWQALQPPPVLGTEVHRLVQVNLVEALPPGAGSAASAHAVLFPDPASVTTGMVGRPISTQDHNSRDSE
jgi:hypothetical protein